MIPMVLANESASASIEARLDPALKTALSVATSLGVNVDDVALLCGLRPPEFNVECAASPDGAPAGAALAPIRVWPGLGGLELFRLQLRALLGAESALAAEDVTFVVRVPGHDATVQLCGLHHYGVASYCAAIGAALAAPCPASLTPSPPPPPPPSAAADGYLCGADAVATDAGSFAASAPGSGAEGGAPQPVAAPPGALAGSGMANDDWIDLLCSVADMLDGRNDDLVAHSGHGHAAAAGAVAAAAGGAAAAARGPGRSHERPCSLEDLLGYFEMRDGGHHRQQRPHHQADAEGSALGMRGLELPPRLEMSDQEEEEAEEIEEAFWPGSRPGRQQRSHAEPTPAVTVTAVVRRAAHAAVAPGAPAAGAKAAPVVPVTARAPVVDSVGAAAVASSPATALGSAPGAAPRAVAAPVLSWLAWRGRRSSATALPASLAQGRNSCTGLGQQQQQQASPHPPAAGTPGGAGGGSNSCNALACCSGNSCRRPSLRNPQSARRLSIIGMRALLATRGSGCYSAAAGCSASGGIYTAAGNAAAAQVSPGFCGGWDAASAAAAAAGGGGGGAAGVTDAEFLILQQLQRWDSLSCGGEWLDEYIYEDGDPCSPAFSIPLPVPPLHQLHQPTAGVAMPAETRAQHPQQQQQQVEVEAQEQLAALQVIASPRARPGAASGPALQGAGGYAGLGFSMAQTVAIKHVPLTADEQVTAAAAAMAAPPAPPQHVLRAPVVGAAGGARVPPGPGRGVAASSDCCRCGRACGDGACCFAGCVDGSGQPLPAPPPAQAVQLRGLDRSLPRAPAQVRVAPVGVCPAPPVAPYAVSAPSAAHVPAPAVAAAAVTVAAMAAPELAWPPPAFRALRIRAVRGESCRRASHLDSLSTTAHPHCDYGGGVGVSHGDGISGYTRLCRNVSTAPAWWAHGMRRLDQVGVFG
ncbi:hypothetical protein HXX76_010223 [Chlamydomonas incerta]|uniref:Uncharacterized protein n=1 Tax=Chlamydomonas incerta TaxID=51695 RepID=A0A835VYC2_CHLIN|nr:hypothetical protein HXX76_010223 [Chlamydomonas incerta]|eukprot:KAG2430124.1 hypothetical protein HXX76_010223 [Chlamydomonas incerta]